MSSIEIQQVTSTSLRKKFATFPWQIYRHDPLWVPPLLADRIKLIDPATGVFFKRGIAEFFMAMRDGKLVGTIMCADDKPTNSARNMKDCMIGFFECVDDREVAWAMFDHAKKWAI